MMIIIIIIIITYRELFTLKTKVTYIKYANTVQIEVNKVI